MTVVDISLKLTFDIPNEIEDLKNKILSLMRENFLCSVKVLHFEEDGCPDNDESESDTDSDSDSESESEEDPFEEDPCEDQEPSKFDKNHATMYAFACNTILKKKDDLRHMSDKNFDKFCKVIVEHLKKVNPVLFHSIRRGDLFENTSESGYRCAGRYIFDVQIDAVTGVKTVTIEHLSDVPDDYGSIPEKFKPIVEFPLDYWNDNKIKALSFDGTGCSSYWHGEMTPDMTMDADLQKQFMDAFSDTKCLKKTKNEFKKYGLILYDWSNAKYYRVEHNGLIYIFKIDEENYSDALKYIILGENVFMYTPDLKKYKTPRDCVSIQ